MDCIFFLNSTLLGAGLAMDAFSVSIVNAVAEPGMGWRRRSAIAGVYAVFQFAMPLIGWLCVHTIASIFTSFQKFVPWIALVLLLFI
ncbi:MAG: manganese efflux pump, partial [Treponema sp.]|nr:manganese efflux pump [Treponema sp.]